MYKLVVKTAADKVHKREIRAPVSFDVKAITAEGLGKVRYVGAWAVKKVLCAEQKNVKNNIGSSVPSTRSSVDQL